MVTMLKRFDTLKNLRRPQHCHQLCTYWVGKLARNGHGPIRADLFLEAMHSLCFSSLNENGRIRLCRTIIETNSSHSVEIINTMLQGKDRVDIVGFQSMLIHRAAATSSHTAPTLSTSPKRKPRRPPKRTTLFSMTSTAARPSVSSYIISTPVGLVAILAHLPYPE